MVKKILLSIAFIIFSTYLIYGQILVLVETTYAMSKSIKADDFAILNGKYLISLDTPYKGFKINIPEEKLENNYVGETYVGEFIYKTYIHQYTDVDLYVSNANYNLKKRNFDEYYITQIRLKNSRFKTLKNITIGSKIEDIFQAYGKGKKSVQNGKTEISYILKDKEMSFLIGKNNRVVEIVLQIIARDAK